MRLHGFCLDCDIYLLHLAFVSDKPCFVHQYNANAKLVTLVKNVHIWPPTLSRLQPYRVSPC